MSFVVRGLPMEEFEPLFGLSDQELKERQIVRKTVDAKPGYPCRVTLEDAEPGEQVLLLNYESHSTPSPYRSSYAIYVREKADGAQTFIDELPPVLKGRPIALRLFDKSGMLIGADLDLSGDPTAKVEKTLSNKDVDYIHAHNAAHGCFAAAITRGS